jgi:hypothetical protein
MIQNVNLVNFTGEVHELRQELHHQNRDKKKDAVKKVGERVCVVCVTR